MRYRLRTLLILLGVLPPALAVLWLIPGLFLFVGLAVVVAWEFHRLRPRSTY